MSDVAHGANGWRIFWAVVSVGVGRAIARPRAGDPTLFQGTLYLPNPKNSNWRADFDKSPVRGGGLAMARRPSALIPRRVCRTKVGSRPNLTLTPPSRRSPDAGRGSKFPRHRTLLSPPWSSRISDPSNRRRHTTGALRYRRCCRRD